MEERHLFQMEKKLFGGCYEKFGIDPEQMYANAEDKLDFKEINMIKVVLLIAVIIFGGFYLQRIEKEREVQKRELEEKREREKVQKLTVFANEFDTRACESFEEFWKGCENANITAMLECAEKLHKDSGSLLSFISRADIPSDVRDAAIDLANHIAQHAKEFSDALQNYKEPSFKTALRIVVRGKNDIANFEEKNRQWIAQFHAKYRVYKTILIKHGVKFE